MRLSLTFVIAVAAGAAVVFVAAALNRTPPAPVSAARELVRGIWISEQVNPADMSALKSEGFKSIIDLRPDGEVKDQPSAADIEAAAGRDGLNFAYVPVPHGAIPDAQVDGLAQALAAVDRPVLLYCRSGKRAARTWALYEASNPAGLDQRSIMSALAAAGQAADDLAVEIATRISARVADR